MPILWETTVSATTELQLDAVTVTQFSYLVCVEHTLSIRRIERQSVVRKDLRLLCVKDKPMHHATRLQPSTKIQASFQNALRRHDVVAVFH